MSVMNLTEVLSPAKLHHVVWCSAGSRWVWRTPLAASEPYWEGWYKGLSDLFMSVITPKVLVLAGTDRLDRSLTVGQMQGKFQLVLLPQVTVLVLDRDGWLAVAGQPSTVVGCDLYRLNVVPLCIGVNAGLNRMRRHCTKHIHGAAQHCECRASDGDHTLSDDCCPS